MKNKIIIPAILSSYRPRVDGSWSISFSTNVLSKEEKGLIDDMHNTAVFLMIKEGELNSEDLQIIDSIKDEDMVNVKSNSVRIKERLYVLWRKLGEKQTFKEYYDAYTNKQLTNISDKIDSI